MRLSSDRYNPPETLRARDLLDEVILTHYSHKLGLMNPDTHVEDVLSLSKHDARDADRFGLI